MRQTLPLLLSAGIALAAAERPNLVEIVVDDLGWADVACNGSPWYETPNIDRLASQGLRFVNGYAACPVCSPSRAALLTGRSPARTRITDWIRFRADSGAATAARLGVHPTAWEGTEAQALLTPPNPFWLDHAEVTVAERLAESGYQTWHIGKWHLGPAAWHPDRHGFQVNLGGCDFGEPPDFFDPWLPRKPDQDERRGIPTLAPRQAGEYLTDREADEALRLLRGRDRTRPFYLHLWHYAVHMPIQARSELIAKYQAKPVPPGCKQKSATYAAMVEGVDQAVGAVLRCLDEEGLTASTVVVFTSDNGGLTGPTSNLPLKGGKGSCWEGGTRVPFIVRWPGVTPAGATSAVPVVGTDLMPTFLAGAGLPAPAGVALDGCDLAPALRGGALGREALFWHFPHYRSKSAPFSSVRLGDLKLVRFYQPGAPQEQLYDLAADPAETVDLAATRTEDRARCAARLDAWLQETGALIPRPNPGWKPKEKGGRK